MSSYCCLGHLSCFRIDCFWLTRIPTPATLLWAGPKARPLPQNRAAYREKLFTWFHLPDHFRIWTHQVKYMERPRTLERLKGRCGGSWRNCRPSCLPTPTRLFCVVESMIYKKKRNFLHQLPLEKFWTTESSYKCFLYSLWKKLFNSGGEQDGRGVGGHGVHVSPQIHQE